MSKSRLIIVSNRLPMTFELEGDVVELKPSAGGLIAALGPIVKQCDAAWVGSTGTSFHSAVEDVLSELAEQQCLVPVYLTDRETRNFCNGFANEILWPLFHDLPSRCDFAPEYWHCYKDVNEKFALAVDSIADDDDVVWVHDYHLLLLADAFSKVSISRPRIAYFHHIPFPAPNIFQKLPWRVEILRALTQFDLVLFQTSADAANFLECLHSCLDEVRIRRSQQYHVFSCGEREVTVSSLPISIDFEAISRDASAPAVDKLAREFRRQAAGNRLILGLDRLDYTKGVRYRLAAYRHLLRISPELHGKLSFIQITVPSRESIPQYTLLKEEIESLISQINDQYGTREWTPITYMYRHLSRTELLAYYRAAEVAMVTPIKDGMNLVAKEYCAAMNENDGVLILSEFAGAASELAEGALLVNPYDVEGMAAALKQAFAMQTQERATRMQKMRSTISSSNVYDWYGAFREALGFSVLHPAEAGTLGQAPATQSRGVSAAEHDPLGTQEALLP
jgi:alpha,alpha-trehalose-phosphate synthase [UDP-forming]